MNTFHYLVIAPKRHERSLTPFVHLHLAKSTKQPYGKDLPLMTAQLTSEREIDAAVETLKRDVDRAGRLAKGALRRAKEKQKTARRTSRP